MEIGNQQSKTLAHMGEHHCLFVWVNLPCAKLRLLTLTHQMEQTLKLKQADGTNATLPSWDSLAEEQVSERS